MNIPSVFWLVPIASVVALGMAYTFFRQMMAADEGTPRMKEIALYVRNGAMAYLKQQYKVVGIVFVVLCALFAFMAYGLNVQNPWVPFAFLTGGFFSGLAGFFGMKTATYASARTANAARESLDAGLQIAFRNLSVGYAVDLFKGYSNFSFSAIQNAFGIDILRRKTSYARGSIDLSGLNKRTEIDAGDVDVTTLFVSGYFAFNRKKFSMPAAFKQSYIQRKSAGSVLAHLDFRYAGLKFDDDNYIAQAGGVRELELYQLAIGVGYGYNYTRSITETFIYNPTTQKYQTHTSKQNGDNIISTLHVDLTPGVTYRFNSHLSADLYLNVLSLSYCHYTIISRKGGNNNVSYNTTSFGTQNYLSWIFMLDSYQLMTSPGQLSSFNVGVNYTF